jgi:1-acyl-sn-glycerol-3-phosphate acyltransferase
VPGIGQFLSFADVAFVDRGSTAQAKPALAPAVEKLRAGVSLVIAPEGTRSYTRGSARLRRAHSNWPYDGVQELSADPGRRSPGRPDNAKGGAT